MRHARVTILAGVLALLGCAASPAPEGAGDVGEPEERPAAVPEPAGPALTEREQDEKRLAELYRTIAVMARDGGDPQALEAGAREISTLLTKLTGKEQADPAYGLMAEQVLLEATRKFTPELHQQLLQAKQRDAAAERQSAITLTNLKLVEAAAAIERFKSENGHPPDALTELDRNYFDPAGARDAWGRPFIYQRRGTGYALGSLGPDGERGTADDQDAAVALKAIRRRERGR